MLIFEHLKTCGLVENVIFEVVKATWYSSLRSINADSMLIKYPSPLEVTYSGC